MDIPPSETSSIQITWYFYVQIVEREYGDWTQVVEFFKSKDYASKYEAEMLRRRAVAVLEAGCDIALNCWGRFDDMTAIANSVPAITDVAERRLLRARSTLRIAQNSVALAARLAALIARRDALY